MLATGWAKWLAVSVFVVLAAGCYHAPAIPPTPTSEVIDVIREAQRAGAAREPLASFHLELARRQLARAEQAEAAGDHQLAARLLARADGDARLAAARARESQVRRRNERARVELQQLRGDERELRDSATSERGVR